MNQSRGFTLLETIIASTIIATILLAMIGLTATQSRTSKKLRDMAFASNLAQQEIDIIQADLEVQRSLASYDTEGRAARQLLYERKPAVTTTTFLLDFFYNNFREMNHDYPEEADLAAHELPIDPDGHDGMDAVHCFDLENGNRCYDANGGYLGCDGKAGNKVTISGTRYVTRVQVFGLPDVGSDGVKVDDRQLSQFQTDPKYLMGDTGSGFSDTSTVAMGVVPKRKLIVVKVYDFLDYLPNKTLSSVPDSQALAKMSVVVSGDI